MQAYNPPMRTLLLILLPLVLLHACTSSPRTKIRSEVRAEHVAAIAVSGAMIVVQNVSDVSLELRRRAATGEIVGVTMLRPGQTESFPAETRRTVELVNTSTSPAGFEVRAEGTGDGEGLLYVGILAQNPL